MALNPRGRVQASEAARRLRTLIPEPGKLEFVASPLSRTRETMRILRTELGLPPDGYRIEPGLIELTFGDWEGLTWREVRKQNPALAAKRESDKWSFVPPRGESYAMLCERVRPVIEGLDRPALVVSHGGVARVCLHLLAGFPEAEAPRVDIWQGRVLELAAGRHSWA